MITEIQEGNSSTELESREEEAEPTQAAEHAGERAETAGDIRRRINKMTLTHSRLIKESFNNSTGMELMFLVRSRPPEPTASGFGDQSIQVYANTNYGAE